jgi:hypothetical protein
MIAWGLSYVPQEQALFQDLTIRDNLRLAVRGDGELGAALDYVFGYFPFLRERLKQKAGTLSGGEQKMLILARALMLRPRLLLVDEISEGLQPSVVDCSSAFCATNDRGTEPRSSLSSRTWIFPSESPTGGPCSSWARSTTKVSAAPQRMRVCLST